MTENENSNPTPLRAVLGHKGGRRSRAGRRGARFVKVGDDVVMFAAYCAHCVQCGSGQVACCENLFVEDFGGRRFMALID